MQPASAFLYYLPGAKSTSIESLERIGLAYAFEGLSVACRETTRGPDEGHGVCVVRSDAPIEPGVFEDRQRWVQCVDAEAWVGVETAKPPRFDDVARGERIPGARIETDAGPFVAPTARRFVADEGSAFFYCALPRRLELNRETRKFEPGGVEQRYDQLWRLAELYNEAQCEAAKEADENGAYSFVFEDVDELATLSIQANYRIGMAELDLLGVWSETLRKAVLDALLDTQRWQEWSQKKIVDLIGSDS